MQSAKPADGFRRVSPEHSERKPRKWIGPSAMNTMVVFSLVDKQIIVTDVANGDVLWAGRPLDRAVADLLQLPDQSSAVALLDYYRSPPDERPNLVRIDRKGVVVWRA